MKHVVFGAGGALGSAIVRYLQKQNAVVKAVMRKEKDSASIFNHSPEIVLADAFNEKQVLEVCQDSQIIYHCINLPYQDWVDKMPKVTAILLKAAELNNACLVFPGNVYGYGDFIQTKVAEDHPLAAKTRKGKLRNQLEQLLLTSHQQNKIRLIIPRFPDFIGPNVTNKMMAPIFLNALKGKKAMWMGSLYEQHSLIDINDAARAAVELALTDKAFGTTIHVAGFGPLTGQEFLAKVFQQAGQTAKMGVYTKTFFSWMGFFIPELKELVEMMYEFEKPFVLDDTKFRTLFPNFKMTSHDETIQKTLAWFNGIQ